MSDILDELWKARNPKDALFLSIIEGYIIKDSEYFSSHIISYDYPCSIFYIKNNIILIRYNKITNIIWINDLLIWSVFMFKFSLNHKEVTMLMRVLLNTHLNLNMSMIFSCSSINIDNHKTIQTVI